MENEIAEFAPIIIKLLQGSIYDEEKSVWSDLLTHQRVIRGYLAKIGLELHLNEQEGFAFLKQVEDEDVKLPRLIRRIPLSYDVTLLCVLIRDILEDFDQKVTDSTRCYVTETEIKEWMEMVVKDKSDRVKLFNNFDSAIEKVVKLGFLKKLEQEGLVSNEKRYEVRRIIKAKISNEELEEIKQRLSDHVDTL